MNRLPVTAATAGIALWLSSIVAPWSAALTAACYLPLWNYTYSDGDLALRAGDGYWAVVPAAVIPGLLATASLTLTGQAQRTTRIVALIWLLLTVVGCGGLTGLIWLDAATDSYQKEHGLTATGPGGGLLLAYLANVLIAGGAVLARREDQPRLAST